jgi:hypothetical protein
VHTGPLASIVLGLCVATVASGCTILGDPGQPHAFVRNETGQTLQYTDSGGPVDEIAPDSSLEVLTQKCRSDPRVETLDGVLIAELDELCEDDLWIISGPGDARMESLDE